MKKIKITITIITAVLLLFMFAGCSNTPACVHEHTTTNYEVSGLSIRKTIVCDDCEKQLEKTTVSKLKYLYNKVLLEDNGIKVTLLDITVDGWDTVTMNCEIEGTSSSKRTFSVEKMFIDGYNASAWMYASELSDNRKDLSSEWLTDMKTTDFIKNQNHEVEMDYSIIDSSSYRTLSEKSVKFNMNEFTSVEEVE